MIKAPFYAVFGPFEDKDWFVLLIKRIHSNTLKISIQKIQNFIREVPWNALKSMWMRTYSGDGFQCRLLFCFKRITCFFLEMPHFQCFFLEMPNFRIIWEKWPCWKQKKNRNWNSSYFGHCHHVNKFSLTCFWGHFMVPPVNSICKRTSY